MYGDENAARPMGPTMNLGQKMRQAEANQACEATSAGYGDMPRRSSLRERIESTLANGDRQMRRLQAAERARQIIDQHPEFAELLDLLNEF